MKKNFSEICIKCHECCQWMTFIINAENPVMTAQHREFYEARGCTVKVLEGGGLMAIMVKTTCPHLLLGRCMIYDKRPKVCRDYDGRWDPNMRDKCQLPKR